MSRQFITAKLPSVYTILESKLHRLAQIYMLQLLKATAATRSHWQAVAPRVLAISFAATAMVIASPKKNAAWPRQWKGCSAVWPAFLAEKNDPHSSMKPRFDLPLLTKMVTELLGESPIWNFASYVKLKIQRAATSPQFITEKIISLTRDNVQIAKSCGEWTFNMLMRKPMPGAKVGSYRSFGIFLLSSALDFCYCEVIYWQRRS